MTVYVESTFVLEDSLWKGKRKKLVPDLATISGHSPGNWADVET
jgi:hypothetical protein